SSSIDVDSSGRPCKEKMSTILYEGDCLISFTSFSVEELTTLKDLEEYLRNKNLESIFQDIIKPVVSKN
ncbi:RWD domain-containing protein 3, partial [Trichonephila clavipes]